jgi:hypothetical protein
MRDKLAILISSYDAAEDLWIPLEESYKKYWKDNPFKIYLATNNIKPNINLFNILNIGNEKSWSDNILKCLDRIDEEYIMLTFDDLFLYKNINTSIVLDNVKKVIDNKWDYLRLHPSPKGDVFINDNISRININRPYRSSTVFAIFKKETFKQLLFDTESAWEFESNASARSDKFFHFYVSNKEVVPYLNAVVKGKWIPLILKYLISEGYSIKKDSRKVMTRFEVIVEKLKRFRLKVYLNLVPRQLQIRIRKILK